MKTAFYLGLLCLGLATPLAAVRCSGRLDSLGAGKRFALSRRESGKKDRYSLVVAADGTGDFTSVQQAIDHVPEFNMHRFVIHIWSRQLNEEETQPFATKTFLRGVDGWDPTKR